MGDTVRSPFLHSCPSRIVSWVDKPNVLSDLMLSTQAIGCAQKFCGRLFRPTGAQSESADAQALRPPACAPPVAVRILVAVGPRARPHTWRHHTPPHPRETYIPGDPASHPTLFVMVCCLTLFLGMDRARRRSLWWLLLGAEHHCPGVVRRGSIGLVAIFFSERAGAMLVFLRSILHQCVAS